MDQQIPEAPPPPPMPELQPEVVAVPERRRINPLVYVWREWIWPTAQALAVAIFITTILFTTVGVDGRSMMPTLHDGERVLVPKFLNFFTTPRRGDIVIFKPPDNHRQQHRQPYPFGIGQLLERFTDCPWTGKDSLGRPNRCTYRPYYIKRVIGVPGDTITIPGASGPILVNGETLEEPYISSNPSYGQERTINVPAGTLFVMGDNRDPGGSLDSRSFGPISMSSVTGVYLGGGRAFAVIWPLNQIRILWHPDYLQDHESQPPGAVGGAGDSGRPLAETALPESGATVARAP